MNLSRRSDPPSFINPTKARHDDPLSRALEPPTGETEEERRQRILAQEEALRISRQIDESIQESKKDHDKWKKAIKVLLLGEPLHSSAARVSLTLVCHVVGQAESGKSTTYVLCF
jgi:hypothetical protein